METERFFSGYCRVLDHARMVEVITEDGEITEVDCNYGHCDFQNGCPIAHEIEQLKNA